MVFLFSSHNAQNFCYTKKSVCDIGRAKMEIIFLQMRFNLYTKLKPKKRRKRLKIVLLSNGTIFLGPMRNPMDTFSGPFFHRPHSKTQQFSRFPPSPLRWATYKTKTKKYARWTAYPVLPAFHPMHSTRYNPLPRHACPTVARVLLGCRCS